MLYDCYIYNISKGRILNSMMSDVYFIESSVINATNDQGVMYCEKT